MSGKRFMQSHEWIKIEGTLAIVGISDHAQDSLGDITFVELPELGKKVSAGDDVAVIESIKAASDIYAPISGIIAQVNETLEDSPEKINESPFDEGWLYKIKEFEISEIEKLMTEDEYATFLKNEN